MTAMFTGGCYLNCHAYLDNPRLFDETRSEFFCILDASLPTVSSGDDSNFLLASLCYHAVTQSLTFLPGFYNIRAKIVPFLPGIHEPSPTYDNKAFAFIGDILSLDHLECDGLLDNMQSRTATKLTMCAQLLPPLNSIIMFSAQVVTMQHGVAMVIDDDHSYFVYRQNTVNRHKKTIATQM
ncbi:hypothetical protein V8E53_003583 [Lactarius tabidus]